jgi:hypothetical protein
MNQIDVVKMNQTNLTCEYCGKQYSHFYQTRLDILNIDVKREKI